MTYILVNMLSHKVENCDGRRKEPTCTSPSCKKRWNMGWGVGTKPQFNQRHFLLSSCLGWAWGKMQDKSFEDFYWHHHATFHVTKTKHMRSARQNSLSRLCPSVSPLPPKMMLEARVCSLLQGTPGEHQCDNRNMGTDGPEKLQRGKENIGGDRVVSPGYCTKWTYQEK